MNQSKGIHEQNNNNKTMLTPNPTKEEIEALIREVERNRRHRDRIRTAVNPEREYTQ